MFVKPWYESGAFLFPGVNLFVFDAESCGIAGERYADKKAGCLSESRVYDQGCPGEEGCAPLCSYPDARRARCLVSNANPFRVAGQARTLTRCIPDAV